MTLRFLAEHEPEIVFTRTDFLEARGRTIPDNLRPNGHCIACGIPVPEVRNRPRLTCGSNECMREYYRRKMAAHRKTPEGAARLERYIADHQEQRRAASLKWARSEKGAAWRRQYRQSLRGREVQAAADRRYRERRKER